SGVIHRDLKPTNILLVTDQHATDGTPHVKRLRIADFSHARLIHRDSNLTQGEPVGTPSYMAPEQARGEQADSRGDVYGLCAILYEMLTGRPPFEGRPPLATMEQVRGSDHLRQLPTVLRPELARGMDRDLASICMMGLDKNPRHRHATAQELAEDLRRFLAGEPIRARLLRRREILWCWCRRNPAVAGLMFALALALLLGTCVAAFFAIQANANAMQARANEERALGEKRQVDETNRQLERTLYASRVALAERYLGLSLSSRAAELLDQCAPGLRGWEWHILKRASLPSLHKRLSPGVTEVRGVAVSPDGGQVAIAATGGTLLLWDLTDHGSTRLDDHKGNVTAVAYSPDGRWLVSGGSDLLIRLWDLSTGRTMRRLNGHTDSVLAATFSSKGDRFATAGHDNTVRVWGIEPGAQLRVLLGHKASVSSLSFSPDGQWLASGSNDQTIKVWNVRTEAEVATLQGHKGKVCSVAFSPGGKLLASAGTDKMIHLWDCTGWQPIQALRGHRGTVWGLAFRGPDEIISVGDDQTVRIWDIASGEEIASYQGHTDAITCIAVVPGTRSVVTGAVDGSVHLWLPDPTLPLLTLRGHDGPVHDAVFAPNGRMIVTTGRDHTVRLWDTLTGKQLIVLSGHTDLVNQAAFHPDGTIL